MLARLRPISLALCLGTAQAGQQAATQAQAADIATTAIGLSLGAAEANPLGPVGVIAAKVVVHQYIKTLPAVEQPQAWRLFGAVGWGAAANNLCIVVVIATGGPGSVLCPALGAATGAAVFSSTAKAARRETFDAICNQARATNPDLICIYTAPAD